MAKFIQMEGNDGIAANGNRIVTRTYLERTWQAGVAVPPDPALPPEVSDGLPSYALGWFVGDYGRLTMLSHSGGPYDFSSEAAFLPEANLGIAVLTNDAACGALAAFAAQYRLFALLLDQELAVQNAFDAFLASVNAQRLAAAIALRSILRAAAL